MILVGDGIETDAALETALSALPHERPARVVIATPIAAASAERRLRDQVAEVVLLAEVEPLSDVSQWYREPGPPADQEI